MIKIILIAISVLKIQAMFDGQNPYQNSFLSDQKQDFIQFLRYYGKSHNDINEQKYQNFIENKKKIELLQKINPLAQYEINKSGDMNFQEFSIGSGKDSLKQQQKMVQDIHNHKITNDQIQMIELPDKFDWRSQGAVGQGQCESCWAFSAVQNIESQYLIKYNSSIEFSPQQLVDCDYHDDRCQGGYYDNAFHFLMEDENLETEKSYPYFISYNLNCNYDKTKGIVKVTNFTKIPKDEQIIKQALVQFGPLSIGIDSEPLQFYKGGIIQAEACKKVSDHAVLLVGYDNKDGQDYWIVKNSYGKQWGIEGYFYLEMGKDACGISQDVTQVLIDKIEPQNQIE